ncbi:MAG: hypothetical protein CSA07_02640 [Bacteroidia bacterium]|nr:MAG: hypothetical protein CSA07_02640 [Bacteroidia bacterium]
MLFPRVYETAADVLAALKLYVDDQIALLRVRTMLQVSGLLSFLLMSIFLMIAAVVFFLLIAVAFGVWVGQMLGSIPLGFLCASGLWLMAVGIVYRFRAALFTDPMLRRLHHLSRETQTPSGGKSATENHREKSFQSAESLEQYRQELERKIHHEEAFIAKRIDGLRSDASNDVMEGLLGVLMKTSSLSLLRRLVGLFKRRTE